MIGHARPGAPMGHMGRHGPEPPHKDAVQVQQWQARRVGGQTNAVKGAQVQIGHGLEQLRAPVVEIASHDQRRIGR